MQKAVGVFSLAKNRLKQCEKTQRMRRNKQKEARLQPARDKIHDFDAKESGENDERSAGVEHSVAAGVAATGGGGGVRRGARELINARNLLSSSRSRANRRPNSMGSSHSGCSCDANVT